MTSLQAGPADAQRDAASIRRWLRVILVGFLVTVLIAVPPAQHAWLCWILVACYLAWSLAIYARSRGDLAPRVLLVSLFVDLSALTALTVLTDLSAASSWTPFLVMNGFFLIPLIAATQLSPALCAAVSVPTVLIYLASGLAIEDAGAEPVSYVLLQTLILAAVALGAVLLSRLHRSRTARITELLDDRNALLNSIIDLEGRERRSLAEALHDGALQYVLGARHELDNLAPADPQAAERIDEALTESARLLRGTMSLLHPAALAATGLVPALRDLIETTGQRSGLTVTLVTDGWSDGDRTGADELLLFSARELLGNVVKHAEATAVLVELGKDDQLARLVITDDGRGLGDVDLHERLAEGHLGLASRRARLKAFGGSLELRDAQPHGTVATVVVPLG